MKEIKELKSRGLNVNIMNKEYKFNVSVICLTLDAPAKTTVQNHYDSTNFKSDYYIWKDLDTLNSKISKIQLPSEIERNQRSLNERHNWKANELRSWLLYYSIGVLYYMIFYQQDILNTIYSFLPLLKSIFNKR